MLRIVIPGQPIATGRARFANGVTYTPQRTRTWQGIARTAAAEALGSAPPLAAPLTLDVTFYMPVPQSWPSWKREAAIEGRIVPAGKPDMDNLLKNVEDAFNKVVWNDDTQVCETIARKRYAESPRTDVCVYTMEALPPQNIRKRDLA